MTGMMRQLQNIAKKRHKTCHENGHEGVVLTRAIRRAQKRGGFRVAKLPPVV